MYSNNGIIYSNSITEAIDSRVNTFNSMLQILYELCVCVYVCDFEFEKKQNWNQIKRERKQMVGIYNHFIFVEWQ